MVRRGRTALLLAALLTAGCGGSRHAAPPTTTEPPLPARLAVGVHYDCLTDAPARRPRVFALLKAAHVDMIRINTNWRALEPRRDSWSASALRGVDDCVTLATLNGFSLDLSFSATPDWAGPSAHAPPSRPGDYARALAYLAHRYHGRVHAWEIWNEENTKRFWTGSVTVYARLLRAADRAVETADPTALVVFGGTYGNDADWLRAAYAAGAGGAFDVMATHPYPDGPAKAAAVHDVMAAHGDGAKPLWFTEIGYAAPLRISLAEQARKLTETYTFVRAHLPYVKAVFWFQALGANPQSSAWEHDLELLNGNLTPRPAYDALKHEAEAR